MCRKEDQIIGGGKRVMLPEQTQQGLSLPTEPLLLSGMWNYCESGTGVEGVTFRSTSCT